MACFPVILSPIYPCYYLFLTLVCRLTCFLFPVTNLSNKGKKKRKGRGRMKAEGRKKMEERETKESREGKGTEALDRVPEEELVKRMN